MNERRPRRPDVAQVGVEFLDVGAEDGLTGPSDQKCRPRWPIRASTIVAITAAFAAAAWVATRSADEPPSAVTPPHHIAYPMSAQLPATIADAITRALPGISIGDAAVRLTGSVVARPTWVAGAVDARYRGFIIQVQIVPGRSSSDALVQITTTGASDIYLIHNRSQSALRNVIITVIATGVARCPTVRLQRMADALGRLPNH